MNEVAEFTVVHYVPDPVADERLNIGVIVLANEQVLVRFLNSWARIKRFGHGLDLGHVVDFAEAVQLTANGIPTSPHYLPLFEGSTEHSTESIRKMISNWNHTIQFTPLQPSLEDPRRLLYQIADRYLKEPSTRRRTIRSKPQVIETAVKSLRRAIDESAVGNIFDDRIVKVRTTAEGKRVKYVPIDFAVANSAILGSGQAISFQVSDLSELRTQRLQAVWSLSDIMDLNSDLRSAIVAAPPDKDQPNFRKAELEYDEIRRDAMSAGIDLVTEDEAADWAREYSESLVLA